MFAIVAPPSVSFADSSPASGASTSLSSPAQRGRGTARRVVEGALT
jgi:hypothetical protein